MTDSQSMARAIVERSLARVAERENTPVLILPEPKSDNPRIQQTKARWALLRKWVKQPCVKGGTHRFQRIGTQSSGWKQRRRCAKCGRSYTEVGK